MKREKNDAGHSQRKAVDRAPVRKSAEWVTMIVSVLIVLSLAGYLAYHAATEDGDEIPVQLMPLVGKATAVEGAFLLPVKIHNRGRRTIQNFRGEVNFIAPDGQRERREFELDYLGERAEEEVHIYLPRHPRELRLEIAPLSYRVE